ncbi:hypothetical protein P3L10_009599 [Capsicum annuum]
MMSSNIAECINGCFVEARKLSILGFLKEVRILFAAWNCKNNEIASYTNITLGKRFEEILTLNGVKALPMTPAGSYLYCVYNSKRRYIIHIERGTCNYGQYQIDEISSNTIVKTYELPIVPIPDKKDWNVSVFVDDEEVFPPKYRRPPSRPNKGRHLKSSESLSSNSNRCSKCGRANHNRRTCDFFSKDSW